MIVEFSKRRLVAVVMMLLKTKQKLTKNKETRLRRPNLVVLGVRYGPRLLITKFVTFKIHAKRLKQGTEIIGYTMLVKKGTWNDASTSSMPRDVTSMGNTNIIHPYNPPLKKNNWKLYTSSSPNTTLVLVRALTGVHF